MILFIYDFRINPEAFEDFQIWAKTKGMQFWESQKGVLRYQTFRRQSQMTFDHITHKLSGDSKHIDVFSEVELEDSAQLESIIKTPEFLSMQEELMEFVESDSLSHSILHKAYDSLSSPVSLAAA